MVKIEQLKNNAKISIIRDGERRQVFLHQLITRQELETLEIESGSVVYSVDESEIIEKFAEIKPVAAPEPAKVSVKEKIKALKASTKQGSNG